MRQHPIQDDAYARTVAAVHEFHKILRRAVARRGREHPRHLIAPAAVERILRDGHKLDVRIPHLLDVRNELVRDCGIAQTVAVRILAPAAEVNLVNVHRRAVGIVIPAVVHPLAVLPAIPGNVVKFRRIGGRGLEMQTVRVAFEHRPARLVGHGVLVSVVLFESGQKNGPYAVEIPHRRSVFVPAVELAHDGNHLRVRRPYGKTPPLFSVHRRGNGRKHLLRLKIRAFVKKIS